MPTRNFWILALVVMLATVLGVAQAQTVNTFPKKEDPLSARVDLFEKLMVGNHSNEGLIMPNVVLPPAGKEEPVIGDHQDAAGDTGLYLAAMAFKFAATKDETARQTANSLMEALVKLETLTGETGCLARSFYKSDAPLWHEQAYFLSQKWHQSADAPEYRWLGDMSIDAMARVMFGVTAYFEMAADDARKKAAAQFADRVLGRLIENNFRILDIDGKTTTRGNACPDLPHENVNALLVLAMLKEGTRVTTNQACPAAYQRLTTKYRYDDQAILAKSEAASDDLAAAASLYYLLQFEKDENLARKYRMSLNRYWHAWKTGADPIYALVYQSISNESVVDEAVHGKIKGLWGFDRATKTLAVPGDNGKQDIETQVEDNADRMILTYWLGRFHKLIDGAW